MEQINSEAIRWLINTEKFYDGTNRHEMKLSIKRYVDNCDRMLLECCPLFAGLVYSTALKMSDEWPDYN